MNRPTIGVLTCLWQRHNLTDVVLRWYQRLREELSSELQLELVAVGSEGETSRNLAESNGFAYLERPNSPLGAKWNAGLGAMREFVPDAVVIVGSDDVVSGNLFQQYAAALSRGVKYIGIVDMYFLDLPRRTLCFWPGYPPGVRFEETLGLGRCLSAGLIEANHWQLWDNWLEKGLDGSMTRRLSRFVNCDPKRWRSLRLHCRGQGVGAVGIKSGTNLWSFHTVVGVCEVEYLDFDSTLEGLFPSDLVGEIRKLSGSGMPGGADLQ